MGEGKFSVKMFAFHFLPIGKQIVGIEFQKIRIGFSEIMEVVL